LRPEIAKQKIVGGNSKNNLRRSKIGRLHPKIENWMLVLDLRFYKVIIKISGPKRLE
jgi:hypothetical protein